MSPTWKMAVKSGEIAEVRDKIKVDRLISQPLLNLTKPQGLFQGQSNENSVHARRSHPTQKLAGIFDDPEVAFPIGAGSIVDGKQRNDPLSQMSVHGEVLQ